MSRLQIKRRSPWNGKLRDNSKIIEPKLDDKPRPKWNDYLTDDEHYKLSKKKTLEKKKLLISKNYPIQNLSVDAPREFIQDGQIQVKVASDQTWIDESTSPTSFSVFDQKDSLDLLQDNPNSSTCNNQSNKSCLKSKKSNENSFDLNYGTDRPIENKIETSNHSNRKSPISKKFGIRRISIGASSTNIFKPTTSVKSHKGTSNTSIEKKEDTIQIEKVSKPTESKNTIVKLMLPLIKDEDLKEIIDSIKSLHLELTHFEQLSGRRTALIDPEELEMALLGELFHNNNENHEENSINPFKKPSQMSIFRYLLQLVCQTMTYLLQNELIIQQQKLDFNELSSRLDNLSKLVVDNHPVVNPFRPSVQQDRPLTPHDQFNLLLEGKDTSPIPVHGRGSAGVDSEQLPFSRSFQALTPPTSRVVATTRDQNDGKSMVPTTPLSSSASQTIDTIHNSRINQLSPYSSTSPFPPSSLGSRVNQTLAQTEANMSPATAIYTSAVSTPMQAVSESVMGQEREITSHNNSLFSTPIIRGTAASDWLFSASKTLADHIIPSPSPLPSPSLPTYSSPFSQRESVATSRSPSFLSRTSPTFQNNNNNNNQVNPLLTPVSVGNTVAAELDISTGTATAPYMRTGTQRSTSSSPSFRLAQHQPLKYNSPLASSEQNNFNLNHRSHVTSQDSRALYDGSCRDYVEVRKSLSNTFEDAWDVDTSEPREYDHSPPVVPRHSSRHEAQSEPEPQTQETRYGDVTSWSPSTSYSWDQSMDLQHQHQLLHQQQPVFGLSRHPIHTSNLTSNDYKSNSSNTPSSSVGEEGWRGQREAVSTLFSSPDHRTPLDAKPSHLPKQSTASPDSIVNLDSYVSSPSVTRVHLHMSKQTPTRPSPQPSDPVYGKQHSDSTSVSTRNPSVVMRGSGLPTPESAPTHPFLQRAAVVEAGRMGREGETTPRARDGGLSRDSPKIHGFAVRNHLDFKSNEEISSSSSRVVAFR